MDVSTSRQYPRGWSRGRRKGWFLSLSGAPRQILDHGSHSCSGANMPSAAVMGFRNAGSGTSPDSTASHSSVLMPDRRAITSMGTQLFCRAFLIKCRIADPRPCGRPR